MKRSALLLLGTTFLLISLMCQSAYAQGTLQFNRVILLADTSGINTVPAGKVWKVTYVNSSTARRATGWSPNWNTITWSATNPNPCTGATSGSTNTGNVGYSSCPSGNNGFLVNGQRVAFGGGNPLWLPAGIQVEVTGTPCRNSVNISVSNVTLYNGTDAFYFCGPLSVAVSNPIQNSPMVSIIEFNIIP